MQCTFQFIPQMFSVVEVRALCILPMFLWTCVHGPCFVTHCHAGIGLCLLDLVKRFYTVNNWHATVVSAIASQQEGPVPPRYAALN